MTTTEVMLSFVGQKEIPPNMGFVDKAFEAMMRSVGWVPRWAWCALLVKLGLKKSGATPNLVLPGAVRTYRAYEKAGRTTKVPVSGCIGAYALYKNGKPHPDGLGHLVWVTAYAPGSDAFATVEGNTESDERNADGTRDGDMCALKKRRLTFDIPKGGNGLRLLGFCIVDEAA